MFLFLTGGNLFLYIACIIANLSSFIIGCAFTWTSIALPILDGSKESDYNPTYELTPSQKLWITSLMPSGAVLSASVSWYFSEKRGRKEVLVIGTLFICIGFTIMYFASSVPYICFARLMTGLGVGNILTTVPIYLGEISPSANRGFISSTMTIFIILGVLTVNTLGYFIPLRELHFILVITSFTILMIIDWWLPESPYWLLGKNCYKNAEIELRKLRYSTDEELYNEIAEMQRFISGFISSKINFKLIISNKNLWKGVFILFVLVTVQQLTAVNVTFHFILNTSNPIFESNILNIVISTTQLLSCLIASILIDRLGRRFLLIISIVGCALSLILLPVANFSPDIWLSLLVIFYSAFHSIGLGPIPFVFLSEFFLQHTKSLASTLTISTYLIIGWCNYNFVQYLSDSMGMKVTFWLPLVVCLVSISIIWCIPDMNGKSFKSIKDSLK